MQHNGTEEEHFYTQFWMISVAKRTEFSQLPSTAIFLPVMCNISAATLAYMPQWRAKTTVLKTWV